MSEIILHTDFPEIIDNTQRESYVTCPRRFFHGFVQKIGPTPPSVHLHAGGAYAAGMEIMRKAFYDKGFSADDSLALGIEALIQYYGDFETPEGSNKSCARMVGALEHYAQVYPLESDFIKPYLLASGKHAIEFTFAVPLPILHPVTGNPILYSGRFDMLGIRDGVLFVEDDKTTSQLGATWTAQWDLNSQFTGYCWAAQAFNFPVAGAIIRGTSILKNGYGDAQAIVYRPQWILDRWYNQLLLDVTRMIEDWKCNSFGYALGASCSSYSGCEYKRLCLTQDQDSILSIYFQQRHWNPLAKDPEAEAEPLVKSIL
jgi:hypothetical protein